jgi:hypothetical protein
VTAEQYRQVQAAPDLERAVVVQVKGYGYDNALPR